MAACLQAPTGCGRLTRGDALVVTLKVPPEEDASLFWYGVTGRSLRITPAEGNAVTLPWGEGTAPEADVREGDQLAFFGVDDAGHTLVSGEAAVDGEKKAAIPLRRAL